MRKDTELLLETVLAAVMAPENDALTLATTLRNSVPDATAMAVIRALLAADRVIVETFNGHASSRIDAQLARALALTLAEAADDLSHTRDEVQIRLGDLLL
ncbi:hypothetical protein [Jannaschia sp. CCS1]|uniref:hypothetical protein n=1 Tax=Jannaschia sp. (strain CCS1) TaxID=290400 RepID=UPI000053ABE2|nr:hypothetical protein [Jannaschia sp. CCS1]ABD53765.1 hypothetical protein Jann_0848 [Jannaschia sp. CCS1]